MPKSFMKAQLEQRVIIKFLSIEGRTAKEIHKQLLFLYGEATYTPATIYK
jgi:galactokinase/mevalonate kinase-like predicted kinase